jgi:pyridoxine 4-dehydrogenase
VPRPANCAKAAQAFIRWPAQLDDAPEVRSRAPTAEQFATLDETAARYGATRAQVALAWLLGHSPVTLAIPGTSSLAHLEENVAAARLNLSGDDIAVLEELA